MTYSIFNAVRKLPVTGAWLAVSPDVRISVCTHKSASDFLVCISLERKTASGWKLDTENAVFARTTNENAVAFLEMDYAARLHRIEVGHAPPMGSWK